MHSTKASILADLERFDEALVECRAAKIASRTKDGQENESEDLLAQENEIKKLRNMTKVKNLGIALKAIDSERQLDQLSVESRGVLLFTDHADAGEGAKNALKRFEEEVLPEIAELASAANVSIAWANIAGIFKKSELTKTLIEKDMHFVGCLLVSDGEIQDHRRIGRLFATSDEYIAAAKDILAGAVTNAATPSDRDEIEGVSS